MSERSFQDIRKVAEESQSKYRELHNPENWGLMGEDDIREVAEFVPDLARAVIEQQEEIARLREQLERKDELIAGFKFGEREAT